MAYEYDEMIRRSFVGFAARADEGWRRHVQQTKLSEATQGNPGKSSGAAQKLGKAIIAENVLLGRDLIAELDQIISTGGADVPQDAAANLKEQFDQALVKLGELPIRAATEYMGHQRGMARAALARIRHAWSTSRFDLESEFGKMVRKHRAQEDATRSKIAAEKGKETVLDRWKQRLLNNRAIAGLVILGAAISGIAAFTGKISDGWEWLVKATSPKQVAPVTSTGKASEPSRGPTEDYFPDYVDKTTGHTVRRHKDGRHVTVIGYFHVSMGDQGRAQVNLPPIADQYEMTLTKTSGGSTKNPDCVSRESRTFIYTAAEIGQVGKWDFAARGKLLPAQ